MPGAWTNYPPDPIPVPVNLAPNGGVDFWQAQEAGALTVASSASPPRIWSADRWYVNNGLGGSGTAGVITMSQQTGVVNGSKFGIKALITTAPVTAPTTTFELYYALLNRDSLPLLGQIASVGCWIKAFGNVSQMGVQFYTAATASKLVTAVGPEALVAVSSTAAFIQNVGVALGTGATTSGIVGVRIRVTAVSSGNIYDLNNGFQVEQLMIVPGNVNLAALQGSSAAFQRCGGSYTNELTALQYDYQKNFPQGTAPVTNAGAATYNVQVYDPTGVTGTFGTSYDFPVPMVANPTLTTYNPGAANANWRDTTNGADRTVTVVGTPNSAGFQLSGASGVAAAVNAINWTADARFSLT